MYQNEIEIIKSRIENKHQGDEKQLEIIFSPNKRLLVEAPAGYGKTHTMVSRIAYLISIGKLPVPKKLLALTFSVNAAYKIKKDVSLKSATKLFSVLLASKRPLITELADKLRLKYPLLPTISPCPTMRLEAIRSIIPISCRRYPKSV